MGSDIKDEYAIMCFPCLRKRPESRDFEPTEDLSNQFEYIVEKYTIRKVPLLLANTVEDIIERREELELAKAPRSQPRLAKDDFVNFQVSQEVYNIEPKIAPCITMAASPVCPGKKALKERPKPSDVLESMSPVTRPTVNSHNYVVIPTKGSLRHKDIMMTKREITNQYLNNFSSVFVDNLKDQVPKDPEQFPTLSRPYTSAFRSFPINETQVRKPECGRRKKGKKQKVAYAFPIEEIDGKEANSIKEEPYSESDSGEDHTSDPPESDFQEDAETLDRNFLEKSKSLVLNDSDSAMDGEESVMHPFKTTIKSSNSVLENADESENGSGLPSYPAHKDEWPNTKNVTYEDIQALDVGYEFTSCEKLGVKPKMTRIPYPIESEKLKESLKLAFGDSGKLSKKCYSQDQSLTAKSFKTLVIKSPEEKSTNDYFSDIVSAPTNKSSSRSVVAETSFLNQEAISKLEETEAAPQSELHKGVSTSSFSKSEVNKGQSPIENEYPDTGSETAIDSVTEISKLYDLSMPISHRREEVSSGVTEANNAGLRRPMPTRSRSFQESDILRRESGPEVKGNDNVPYQNPNSPKKDFIRLHEPETETTCSLYSRESKTSSLVTTGISSELDEGKRATLRWKIVIKHHREDDPSKRNVNVNIRH